MSNLDGQFTVDMESAKIIAAAIDRLVDTFRDGQSRCGCNKQESCVDQDLNKTTQVAGMHIQQGYYINQYAMTEKQARAFVRYCVNTKNVRFGEGYTYLGNGSQLDYIMILDNEIAYTSYEPEGKDARDITDRWLYYIEKCQEL